MVETGRRRRRGERGGICAAIKCALDLRRAGSGGTGQSGGAGIEWRQWTGGSGGTGRMKGWVAAAAFGCLSIAPRMARAFLDGLRVRYSVAE